MAWFEWIFWPRSAVSNIEADTTALRVAATDLIRKSDTILKEIKAMGDRENAAYASLNANIAAVKEGWAVLVASNATKDQRIAELESALADADADAAANLAAALDADSESDAAKVEAADAAIAELVAPAPEPTPEPAPVDEAAPVEDDQPPAA